MNARSAHFRSCPARGFTLAELIVATVMMAILSVGTYMAISQILRARDRSQARADAYSRATAAADLISADAGVALRDADLKNCRIAIVRNGRAGQGMDGLLLFSHLTRVVRPDSGENEGEEAEVQFRLEPTEPAAGTVSPGAPGGQDHADGPLAADRARHRRLPGRRRRGDCARGQRQIPGNPGE